MPKRSASRRSQRFIARAACHEMTPAAVVSVAALRRYVVAHQGYASRFRHARRDDVAAEIGRLQAVQLDSIATVDRAHRITLASRIGGYSEDDVSRLLARGPLLRVLGARGVPAADRGLPALQAAHAGAARPALVGPQRTVEGREVERARARAHPRRGRAARARVRRAQRADVGLEAGEARARAPASPPASSRSPVARASSASTTCPSG